MDKPKTEPAADLREAANGCWQLFTALRDEGFTEQQTLLILGQVIAAGVKGSQS